MHSLKSLYANLNKVFDVIGVFLAFFIAWFIKFESNLFPKVGHLDVENYLLILAIFLPSYFLLAFISRVYQPATKKSALKVTLNLFRANIISLAVVVIIFYIIKQVDYSRIFLALFILMNFALSLINRYILKLLLISNKNRFIQQENILIIGESDLSKNLIHKIQSSPYVEYNMIGIIDDYSKSALAKISELENVIKMHHVDEIIIALRLEEYKKLPSIINICEKYGIRTYIIPDYLRYIPSKAQIEEFEGIPLINIRYSPLDEWTNRFIKRSFDIVVSLIGLILCFPLFIIIAILIKLTSKGPILFTQERVGYNRRVFKMHKFRTMYVQDPDEEKIRWTTKDDPRRTPIGKILRRLSLDELPQLWDVLVGNMSLVGPRPERPYFVEKFKEEIPKYMIKHRVRPGITGWAQIHGLRGDTSIEERIKYDIWYIENWSFWLDIKIILATIFGGKFMENAY
ncbi:Undecaprenyl-phosphate glucose phosphotransferase [Caldicellulosiruptor bescii]|uniref:Undecaprenyl-phosphate glucose phosphotransferase n=2 Tax=Caldicellulosiruptor bescii TaxID=31899 RepID=B9MLL6_CALBD|nr:undecaprenyl-phosphate glucose phosphotransferase [Caldicellulosiruptor bescii]ACM59224.1 Undecaprenyl-phosphate glucose phosphotransferase [Caldicellulosiruptor bescii DSM 6725]PBC88319.1 Undecaprenyl-phosphate glucose phosphotransferase [Caldicellulosiruptor bescii]PBC92200.1 Undecaprenyl-phosphate glucose phosphotransferase [Caldicellulosiruptor bescii]PBD04990.1 Undecaprenyl-phosphate glucose phosphotransferase [Caldicellulosiruptor bescii]PBD05379.1 Undecaprenyl-phosphate glucose phosp